MWAYTWHFHNLTMQWQIWPLIMKTERRRKKEHGSQSEQQKIKCRCMQGWNAMHTHRTRKPCMSERKKVETQKTLETKHSVLNYCIDDKLWYCVTNICRTTRKLGGLLYIHALQKKERKNCHFILCTLVHSYVNFEVLTMSCWNRRKLFIATFAELQEW